MLNGDCTKPIPPCCFTRGRQGFAQFFSTLRFIPHSDLRRYTTFEYHYIKAVPLTQLRSFVAQISNNILPLDVGVASEGNKTATRSTCRGNFSMDI